MSRNRTNKPAVEGAEFILDKFKNEIATELGMPDYDKIDKGNLTARQNGYVGGYMTRKLVQIGEQALMNGFKPQ